MDLALVLEIIAYVVIFLGGAIANILVIRGTYLIHVKKIQVLFNRQNECKNLLILNLAVTDLLILLVSLPTDVVVDYVGWPFGEFTCKFISPVQDVCMCCSAFTFTALAIERYLVTKGTSQRGVRSGKRVLLGIWLVSWITMGIPLAKYKKIIVDEDRLECDVVWPNIYVARFFLFYIMVLVLGCAVTGAVCYCSIRRNLATINKCQTKDNPRGSSDSFVIQTHRVSKMLCVLVVAFVICVLPLPLLGVFLEMEILTDPNVVYPMYIGTSCLLYSNTLANPIIVLLMSRECRATLSAVRIFPRKANKCHDIALAPICE